VDERIVNEGSCTLRQNIFLLLWRRVKCGIMRRNNATDDLEKENGNHGYASPSFQVIVMCFEFSNGF
jgi:hypothetical protein